VLLRTEPATSLAAASDIVRPADISGTRNGIAVQWLRESAAAGSVTSMYQLGAYLLGNGLTGDIDEGYSYLDAAARQGSLAAMTELGIHLLTARGSGEPSVDVGGVWLRRAADEYDTIATILYARHLDRGELIVGTPYERRQRLHAAGLRTWSDYGRVGLYLYAHSLTASTQAMRKSLLLEATRLFTEGSMVNELTSCVALAYLLRRRLTPSPVYSSIEDLLRAGVLADDPFAQVNQALAIAMGADCRADWRLADDIMRDLSGTAGVLDWWYPLALDNDAEGHLVMAWLYRHGLVADFQDTEARRRFHLAREAGAVLPAWLTDDENYGR